MEALSINNKNNEKNPNWIEETQKPLFKKKRATELAKLLKAKKTFVEAPYEDNTKKLQFLLSKDEGRQAITTALIANRKCKIGSNMMDIIVCGSIPPYNELLGGKLVSILACKNCYSDHMSDEELELVHIHSRVEDLILELLESRKIVFLTGNPGDGKTFLIKRQLEKIKALNTYIETDLNRVANYEEVANKLVECYEQETPAIVAVNEYQFYQLCKIMKRINNNIYTETMNVKKDCIIYDIPNVSIKRIVIVDLNERSLLDKDRALTEEIIDRICSLLKAEDIQNTQLKKNLTAIEKKEIRTQMIKIIELATTSSEHYAVRDILGAVSFILTACTMEEYEGMPYYDAVFESTNPLLETVKQFDPIYLSHSVMDEALWNGEIKEKWLLDSPTEWPSAERYEEDVEGAVECFKSIKRKYYFENEDGANLFMLQPDEIKRCTEIFTSFETQKKQIKERIIRGLNKLFLPSSDDKKLLRIWTTHRYDLSIDAGVAISSRYIDASELEIKMPKPNDWMKGMEYVPNHVLLKPREQEKPVLILDVDFLRTLDAVEAGYPIGLLAPQYEQTVTRFLRQLDDYNLTEDNDDGEIIIANRKKSYKKSIYVIDNKYNFEEED